MTNFIEIRAHRRGNGTYGYTGLTEDGRLVVLHKVATRLYANAYYYEKPVASGSSGLAAHFLYGKNKPTVSWNGEPLKIFRIVAP